MNNAAILDDWEWTCTNCHEVADSIIEITTGNLCDDCFKKSQADLDEFYKKFQ